MPSVAAAGEIQSEEVARFLENGRVRRVEILRFGIVEHPTAEGDHVARDVDDREHDASAEIVVEVSSLLASSGERRGDQFVVGVAERAEAFGERVERVRRVPETEVVDGRARQRAFAEQVFPCRRGFGVVLKQFVVEEVRRLAVHFEHPYPVETRAGLVNVGVDDRDPHPLRQKLNGVGIVEILDPPDETDGVARGAAAETVETVGPLEHGERRASLAMERAEPDHIGAGAFQGDVTRDQLHDVGARNDLLNDFLRDHTAPPLHTSGMKSRRNRSTA